ncbi:hypothetical protein I4U23_005249 [Adineta vaga]|nr:hypothetical protein I4U23_005249 [Adineta vaga]
MKPTPSISLKNHMIPPQWALMERLLFDQLNKAAFEFVARYTRPDGTLIWRRDWPGMDGSDDPYEAVNDHLLVFISDSNMIYYQCLSFISERTQKIQLELSNLNHRSVALGKEQTNSQLYFVVQGMNSSNSMYFMTKVTVNCNNTQSKQDTVFFSNTTFYEPTSHVLDVNPNGEFAYSCTDESILVFDLIHLTSYSYKLFNWSSQFVPTILKVDHNQHIFLLGCNRTFRSVGILYLIVLNINHSFAITDQRTEDPQDGFKAGQNLMMDIFNDNQTNTRIILTLSRRAMTYLFTVNQSNKFNLIDQKRFPDSDEIRWYNHGKKFLSFLYSDKIFSVYDMKINTKFDDSLKPIYIFPNDIQKFSPEPELIRSLQVSLNNDTLYILMKYNCIFMLTSSRVGYYSVSNLFPRNSELSDTPGLIFSLISNGAQCPRGTYKNETGFWLCKSCEITTNQTCSQCTEKEFCPSEFPILFDQFEDIEQNSKYPQSPEIDIFDDLILYYIFQTNCGFHSPFFLILISFVLILICLTAKQLEFQSNFAREFNFSKRLNNSDHRLSQNALINLDLTRIINITEGFTKNDETIISGLWYSKYKYDFHQILINRSIPLEKTSDTNSNFKSCHKFINYN